MREINFNFKKQLDRIIGGELHSYCYQCGACVGDCPAARYSERFNPRRILLQVILGQAEELLAENSVLWECTNCYNCYERCPQDVRPVEVIVALKNICAKRKTNPDKVRNLVQSVVKGGRTVLMTTAAQRMREELGLEPLAAARVEELQKILKD